MAVTNCLNFGNPERSDIFWQFKEAVRGLADAAGYLELPVVSGNVSFYNESFGEAIFPTPIVGVVGLLGNIAHRRTAAFPGEDLLVILVGEEGRELGGSEYLKVVHGLVGGVPPRLDLEMEKKVQTMCIEGIRRGFILSAHDCSEGGLAVALAECCCAGGIGARLEVNTDLEPVYWLFGESQSRLVVTLEEKDLPRLESLASSRGVPFRVLGRTGGDRLVVNDWVDLPVEEIRARREEALVKLLEKGTEAGAEPR
jgi:phosphoribosylformylglycinamidine synthase